ncbi:MAG TPA: carboxymuconolactone decarboxylase family protein [Opitutales bacterium]|nr:carboxymuconolactone decarboxylase family protein [Opitutales bacterium]
MSRISAKPSKFYPWYLRLMYWRQRRRFGQPLVPTQIWGRQPVLLRRFLGFFRALERKNSPLPAELRALITVRVSQINHCAFCVDFNSMRVLRGGGEAKLEALQDFASSERFTEAEKAALAYAEAVTHSDRDPDDALFDRLRSHFDDDAIVELTALIAFQNMSSKFNAALDLPAQGLCELPGGND